MHRISEDLQAADSGEKSGDLIPGYTFSSLVSPGITFRCFDFFKQRGLSLIRIPLFRLLSVVTLLLLAVATQYSVISPLLFLSSRSNGIGHVNFSTTNSRIHTDTRLSLNSSLSDSGISAHQRDETILLKRYEIISAWTSSLTISLRSYLSSCNAALLREQCDIVALSSGSKSCVMGVRSYAAGLGHQMSEVLMWLRYAHLENTSHVFELFGPVVAAEHGDSYEWANSFFGLIHAVRSMRSSVVNDVNINLSTTHQCDDVNRPGWLRCGRASSGTDSEAVSCFKSPRMVKLFATYAPCLRQSALCFGDWVSQAQALPFDPAVVNVVWHIRAGDTTPYEASSRYFREVLTCTSHLTHQNIARHSLLQRGI
jgi:hypothetical protein